MITPKQMRLVINDVELAVGNFTGVVKLLENADDMTVVKVTLGSLRQLVNCYPALNKIVNDPTFKC